MYIHTHISNLSHGCPLDLGIGNNNEQTQKKNSRNTLAGN